MVTKAKCTQCLLWRESFTQCFYLSKGHSIVTIYPHGANAMQSFAFAVQNWSLHTCNSHSCEYKETWIYSTKSLFTLLKFLKYEVYFSGIAIKIFPHQETYLYKKVSKFQLERKFKDFAANFDFSLVRNCFVKWALDVRSFHINQMHGQHVK